MSDNIVRINTCELKTLEEINLKAVESSPDAIVITDDEGIITVFNQRAEYIFGYGREEVLGKKIEILVPELLRDSHIVYREEYVLDPYVKQIEEKRIVYGLHKKGTQFILEISLAPLIITGAGVYVMAVIRKGKKFKWNQTNILKEIIIEMIDDSIGITDCINFERITIESNTKAGKTVGV